MLKNNRGVTILALVVTIVIILMLAGISLNSGFSVVDDMRVGRVITNMTLVQAKVQIINEKYSFDNHITLVGAGPYKISSSNQLENITMSQKEIKLIADKANVSEADVLNWNWYKWNNSDLVSQNLDKNMLGDSEYFYVNYEHAEILYSNKTSKNNLDYYSMTGLKNINK